MLCSFSTDQQYQPTLPTYLLKPTCGWVVNSWQCQVIMWVNADMTQVMNRQSQRTPINVSLVGLETSWILSHHLSITRVKTSVLRTLATLYSLMTACVVLKYQELRESQVRLKSRARWTCPCTTYIRHMICTPLSWIRLLQILTKCMLAAARHTAQCTKKAEHWPQTKKIKIRTNDV